MTRLAFDHIAWSKKEPFRHRHDLADSAVATPDLEALGLPAQVTLPGSGHGAAISELEESMGARISAPGGRVLLTAGASEANACVYAALLSPGDQVMVESPGYEPHGALAELFGIRLSRFARRREHGFGGFVDAIESASSAETRMVVVSHLHNPSGVPLGEADVEALDRLADRLGLWVLCDETFREASTLPLGTAANRGPRWISTASLTKAYGLGGLRMGWVAAGAEVLERSSAAQNGLSVMPSHPSVVLTRALMPHLDTLRGRARRLLDHNCARWSGFVERAPAMGPAGAALDPGMPPAGTTAWCRLPAERDGGGFVEFASERFGVAVTPGRFFGDARGFRVGLGGEPERFAAALTMLERALEAFVLPSATSGAHA